MWPTNFFKNQIISKELIRAETEYMNIHSQLTL